MICFFSLILFFTASAMAVPTPQMAKEVIDYYYNGQEQGPVLMEARLCKSFEARECIDEIDPKSVSLGETINVWMKFLVPKGASYDDILVEFKHKDIVWHVTPYKVESSVRYRVIDKYTPNKSGKWTVTIKKATQELKAFTINIIEK